MGAHLFTFFTLPSLFLESEKSDSLQSVTDCALKDLTCPPADFFTSSLCLQSDGKVIAGKMMAK